MIIRIQKKQMKLYEQDRDIWDKEYRLKLKMEQERKENDEQWEKNNAGLIS